MKTARGFKRFIFVCTFVTIVASGAGCVSALFVQEIALSAVEEKTYGVIIYRGAGPRGLDSIVILDPEDDALRFETDPPLPPSSRIPNKSRHEALATAVEFLRQHAWFASVQISALKDADGRVAGYEVRPIYEAIHSGDSDPLLVTYKRKDAGTMLFRVDFRRTEEAFEQDRRR